MFAVMMYGLFIIVAFYRNCPCRSYCYPNCATYITQHIYDTFIGYPKSQHYGSGTEI